MGLDGRQQGTIDGERKRDLGKNAKSLFLWQNQRRLKMRFPNKEVDRLYHNFRQSQKYDIGYGIVNPI